MAAPAETGAGPKLMDTTTLITLSTFLAIAIRHISAWPCEPDYCDPTLGPQILFPFRLADRAPARCGYPGFDLRCDRNNKTILRLPRSGDFVVDRIDYAAQALFVNDPGSCLPARILNFSLSDSPFRGAYVSNYTFLNCSSDYVDLQLVWSGHECWRCEKDGGFCWFKGDSDLEIALYKDDGLDITCYPRSKSGLPRGAKLGFTIVHILGGFCFIGLLCYLFGMTYCRRLNPDLPGHRSSVHPTASTGPPSSPESAVTMSP